MSLFQISQLIFATKSYGVQQQGEKVGGGERKSQGKATAELQRMMKIKEYQQRDGCQGKRPCVTSPRFTSASVIICDTELFISPGLNRL